MGLTMLKMDKMQHSVKSKRKVEEKQERGFALPRLKTSDKFHVAFTRSDTEFLTVAVKKRASQKVGRYFNVSMLNLHYFRFNHSLSYSSIGTDIVY